MNRLSKIFFTLSAIILSIPAWAQQRFPKPEFETGYVQPATSQTSPRLLFLEYLDVFVLMAALAVATWFVVKKRSRRGVMWTSVFSLLYFGFYREGCICSIGAIQNITLAIFDPAYVLPLTALLFFLLPLVVSLFYGRTFCAGVCPLGAIQDLVAFRPIELPKWLQKVLGMIPYLYLGLAILYAATRSEFLICRYDPFVGFFRFDADFQMLLLGGLFLLVGIFVARPYCRFFCPYGVLLGWMSTFSKKHMQITPSNCIQCKLCANSCPFGAIEKPVEEEGNRRTNVQRLMTYLFFIPLWIGIGGLAGSALHVPLAKFNKTVYLAEQLVVHPEFKQDPDHLDARAFMQSGKSMDTLVEEAKAIRSQFYWGGWLLGGFMGLVVGLTLVKLASHRNRKDYEPDKTNCLSCGRCMDYCPVKN
ncbi:4Fe-4S binding protein [Sunxiuqinia elliptica]|uniref:4Fe-4S binding domain-containing protein n=1 Tax=Sunxiuqinia elliptica TaxID=655355 RepID=A0A1I2LJA8_9BACT|nr:4Fe-4S binding protein [Sunxiuqinia elliptica]SFF79542.1 4Fe-4S binding domain-containing protein [Sunxiuqinia elliptica]